MNMTKHYYFIIVFFAISLNSVCQTKIKNSPKDFGFTTFSIKGSKDNINFIVSDTTFRRKKPVFIFCQGSLPYALFYKEDSIHTWQQSIPFNYKKYLTTYNFVVISKPGIPVFTNTADSEYFYIDPITKRTPEKYLTNDNLDYRVSITNDVVNFLVKQSWVDKSNIIIAGHSEGSKIVAKVCATNKNISKAIFLAGNPYSRFDQGIRQIQRDILLKKKTTAEGKIAIDELNEQIQKVINYSSLI